MSKRTKVEQTEQELQETIKRGQAQLRVLGVMSFSTSDGTVAMFTSEFLRRLADEADRSPDKSALVFLKRVEL